MKSNIERYMDNYSWFRSILDSRFRKIDSEVKRDLICRVLAKYYGDLRDIDVERIIADIIDHYDKALSIGELKKLVENIVLKYTNGYRKMVKQYEGYSSKDKLLLEKEQLVNGIEWLKEQLNEIDDIEEKRNIVNQIWDMHCKIKDLDREIEKIDRKIEERRMRKNKSKGKKNSGKKIIIKKTVENNDRNMVKGVKKNRVKKDVKSMKNSIRISGEIGNQNDIVFNPILNKAKIERKKKHRVERRKIVIEKMDWKTKLLWITICSILFSPAIYTLITIIKWIILQTNMHR